MRWKTGFSSDFFATGVFCVVDIRKESAQRCQLDRGRASSIDSALDRTLSLAVLLVGRGTSPATNEPLESTSLVTNHTVKKLIAALLEEHRRASRG